MAKKHKAKASSIPRSTSLPIFAALSLSVFAAVLAWLAREGADTAQSAWWERPEVRLVRAEEVPTDDGRIMLVRALALGRTETPILVIDDVIDHASLQRYADVARTGWKQGLYSSQVQPISEEGPPLNASLDADGRLTWEGSGVGFVGMRLFLDHPELDSTSYVREVGKRVAAEVQRTYGRLITSAMRAAFGMYCPAPDTEHYANKCAHLDVAGQEGDKVYPHLASTHYLFHPASGKGRHEVGRLIRTQPRDLQRSRGIRSEP